MWFESGVSHAAVLKAQDKGWWPADLYLEGSDQHRGWFHSALLASITTDSCAPYKAVLTHGFVLDGEGKKMSKSAGNVVTPQEVIERSGAEILRLWVASQDYQEDLRISPDILKQLMEAYRKFRNTCRFMLGNLYDFDPAVDTVPLEQLPELDRWALGRWGRLLTTVRQAYDQFEFRQFLHEIEYFCSVDMSATYLDILKDRLYTFHKKSSLRRGSQTVLLEVVTGLAKILAPILSFTSEEIWQRLPNGVRQNPDIPSVHLAAFPEAQSVWMDPDLEQHWSYLLRVRTVVQGVLEKYRRDKIIGSSLEAKVIIQAQPEQYEALKKYEQDLPTLFIVSQVAVNRIADVPSEDLVATDSSLGITVSVETAEGRKCERCWNYRPEVGADTEHPALCDRCLEAIR